MSRNCRSCQKPMIDNERVREAAELMGRVDHYGNLHVYVSDANLEDWFFEENDDPSNKSARQYVVENACGASVDELDDELELVTLLESMTQEERISAYGTCNECDGQYEEFDEDDLEVPMESEAPTMPTEGEKKRVDSLAIDNVEFVPEDMKDGVLYVSEKYRVAIHRCCCGCGSKVVTPIGNGGWRYEATDGRATLSPSIGSWSLPCRSHYFIRDGRVEWC